MSKPLLYRKKPVTIEAMQWDGTAAGATPIIDWVLANGATARYHDAPDPTLAIDTLEGTMLARPQDYVIRGVAGEFYPCKPDIFEGTYESLRNLISETRYTDNRVVTKPGAVNDD